LTEAYLRRIQALDNQLDAFITLTADLALRRARKAETAIMNGNYRGPLHGIPFGLKDVYDTAGIRTTVHSKICIDNVPRANATAVQRLHDAGTVLLGAATFSDSTHGPGAIVRA
jgi:aspartyl-tRNA(Asn)/glutamyl-tRNA(Gln) amidotransferase subunit A